MALYSLVDNMATMKFEGKGILYTVLTVLGTILLGSFLVQEVEIISTPVVVAVVDVVVGSLFRGSSSCSGRLILQ
jgi:hypothetical protein